MPDVLQADASYSRFVQQLWETGRVEVVDIGQAKRSPVDDDAAWLQLQWFASEEQQSLPGKTGNVSQASAEWALRQFYRACSFLVHRTHAEADLRRALSQPVPEPKSPAVCYSVDLVFRFLPDLHRLAKELSEHDPLVGVLQDWGAAWPLSSVGMKFTAAEKQPADQPAGEHPQPDRGQDAASQPEREFDLAPFWNDGCLRQMYVDRVIRHADRFRLADARVAMAVRSALGNYPDLAPGLAELPNAARTS